MKHVDVRPVVDCVSAVLRLNHKMYGSRKAQTSSWFVSSRESMVLGPQTQSGQSASLIQEYVLPAPNLEKVKLGWATETILLLRCFVVGYKELAVLTRYAILRIWGWIGSYQRQFRPGCLMNFFGARNDYFLIKILQIFQYTG